MWQDDEFGRNFNQENNFNSSSFGGPSRSPRQPFLQQNQQNPVDMDMQYDDGEEYQPEVPLYNNGSFIPNQFTNNRSQHVRLLHSRLDHKVSLFYEL